MNNQQLKLLLDAQMFVDNYKEAHSKGANSEEHHEMIIKYYQATKIIEGLLSAFEIIIKPIEK